MRATPGMGVILSTTKRSRSLRFFYLSGDVDKPLALVGELCPQRTNDDLQAWQNAWLAGDVLREIGRNRVTDTNLGRDLLERVQMGLVQILEDGRLTAQERSRAGITLPF